ncbi:MAG: hypothetical protein M3016_01775 [Actinomycetota bacterium]|nr:hypothetical protein [Actinomycetota bacterium]
MGYCAPHQRASAVASPPNLRHREYFHDHSRIERMLFDGTAAPREGELSLTDVTPGNGLTWRAEAAASYRVA